LAWRRGWLDIRIILVAVFILAVVAFGMRTMIIERLTTDDGGSAESRLPLMQLAFRMIQDHPIGGVGANNVPVVIHQYATPELGNVWLYSIHNKYLLVWSETGPLTLLAYLAFLLVTLRRGWRVWRFNDRFLSPLALGFTVAIMGSMFHMFFDVFRSRPEMQTLWVNSALIVAMLNMEANHEPREQHSSSA
ncbi:MAG: O-antigen ligase family protein, partial [Candidatus Methanoperedens sp.]|nr:O-antigen ligase family protein [Candidatus Methanoperedens sp.]